LKDNYHKVCLKPASEARSCVAADKTLSYPDEHLIWHSHHLQCIYKRPMTNCFSVHIHTASGR